MRKSLGLVSALALLQMGVGMGAACTSSGHDAPADGGGDGAADGSPDGGGTPGDAGVSPPDTAPGRALGFVLGALGGTSPTEAEVNAHFAPAFLQQVPAADLIGVLAQLAAARPWTLVGFDGAPSATTLVAILTRGDGQYWRLTLATDLLGRIAGALFQPAGDLDPALDSWEEIDLALGALAPRANLLAATVDAAGCTPLHAAGADASLALGSTFKLWVLAGLAADVAAGKHSWTEMIPIEEAKKSLPSGMLQDQPAGTLLPVRTFAEHMISISDNTAADHLLFLVGRDGVEATLAATGHHDPSENEPFLATRELFNLKLMVTSAEQQAYLDAAVDGKRALLTDYDARYDPRAYAGPAWTEPRLIDRLEWFATPTDLCGVMRALRDAGGQAVTAPVLDVLAINPGIPDPVGAFSYVGYKGGSEPGVSNFAWLLRRRGDQQWLFFTLGLNDTAKPIDDDRAVYLAEAARALVGRM